MTVAMVIGIALLIWNSLEVGRNDAANLVNAVYGARVLDRRKAVMIAGIAVVLGAYFSGGVIETARKGIFTPGEISFEKVMSIYLSVYFVNTVLLYGFSGFGMPVSTTACLVFSLMGASLFLAGPGVIDGKVAFTVIIGIVVSIIVSGIASFLVMRVFRGAIRDRAQDRDTVLLHGPWIAGAMLTWLLWFMVFKGMKNVEFVSDLHGKVTEFGSVPLMLLFVWATLTFIVHLFLALTHGRWAKYLFHFTAVIGMICMAFAFGQNDLANCASPGLSAFRLWQNMDTTTALASKVAIPKWALFGCGFLMAAGMFTNYAQRVTRAEVNTGSQYDQVALYAPGWCRALARVFLRRREGLEPLAPAPARTDDEHQKKIHYDTLRASLIMAVSASVIAFASGLKLPVSTTYVAFAAVIGTGFSDRVFARGDSDLKLGRAIWVVTCWLLSPIIAVVAAGLMALGVYHLGIIGLGLGLVLNLVARFLIRRQADRHEETYHGKTNREEAAAGVEERRRAAEARAARTATPPPPPAGPGDGSA